MLDSRHKKLVEDGTKLFSDKKSLDSLHQEIADNFYPEYGEFTFKRSLGVEFADHLTTSYPLIARRTLGDALSALLRPINLDTTSPGVWFEGTAGHEKVTDSAGKEWLEMMTGNQRRHMYDRSAQFVRATKEGDHAFVSFGQTPIQFGLNRQRNGLLYRNHHLRDFVWTENAEGQINHVQRKWHPTAIQLFETFRDRVSERVKKFLTTDPYKIIETRHIVIDTETYEGRGGDGIKVRTPWVSIWVDVDHDQELEVFGSFSRIYIIPRWVTVPGSQYASSPAVTAALPDARLIQAMTLTMLEAGEKFADPPMVATQEAIRGGIELFAGGVTYVDSEYDERLGDALRPAINPNTGQGMGVAFNLRDDLRNMIDKAFFLDSLSLPPAQIREMTAFEVSERISEWIRRAMPIFEPMEFEYNGTLIEETFDLLLRNGAFGSLNNIPESLRGTNIQFKFESPLHDSASKRKGQKFLEAQETLAQAAQVDPSVLPMINARVALRDVLDGIGVPTKWTRDERELEELDEQRQQAEQTETVLAGAGAAAAAAKDLASASKDFAGAQTPAG